MIRWATWLACAYVAATTARAVMAQQHLSANRMRAGGSGEAELTVLQPILGGDPTLAACLEVNLDASPQARFIWLLDHDDVEGQACAARWAGHTRVATVVGPPPGDGENPKVAKLARALPMVSTSYVAVLDDDTVLPPGGAEAALAALSNASLATGLPFYVNRSNFWSRLVCGFVNGSALLTYPAAACVGANRTINGMFYVARTEELRTIGGFDAVRGKLTDDYAVASLFLRSGRRIVQTAVVHDISTSVRDGRHYRQLMRRWMIFGLRYARENRTPFTMGLIGAPTLAPPLLLAVGAAGGPRGLVIAAAAFGWKALLNAGLRRRYAGRPTRLADMAAEIAADILVPFHLVSALVAPNRLEWRNRRVRMDGESIRYE